MLLDVIIKELKKEAPSNKRRECIKGFLESGHKLSSQITGDMRRLDIFMFSLPKFILFRLGPLSCCPARHDQMFRKVELTKFFQI